MFDTHNTHTQKLNFTAVSGNLIKSCQDSFFVRFHLKSEMSKRLLDSNPFYGDKRAVVLQSMVVGDMEVLCEVIYRDDYEKMFDWINVNKVDTKRA
ncbi:hypothetical protein, partial [Enterococcus faecalis]|uniref:hypothetical protein n=2 Tax=Enterococcus faecalis TaxID=1351 RepID=UPI0022E93854